MGSLTKHRAFPGPQNISGNDFYFKKLKVGNHLAIQQLGVCIFTAQGPGSILGQGTKIPQGLGQDLGHSQFFFFLIKKKSLFGSKICQRNRVQI